MDLVNHVTETFDDVVKRFRGNGTARGPRKMRRGDKMQKFMDKLDPTKRAKDRPSSKLASDRTQGLENNRAS